MRISSPLNFVNSDQPVDIARDSSLSDRSFQRDVIEGLSSLQKTIPGKYLWDGLGSSLFDQICNSKAYYPTARESTLLSHAVADLAAVVGPGVCLVEIGSGASHKIRILLDALVEPKRYVAIDISQEFMGAAARRIEVDYPGLEVLNICADYSAPLPSLPIDRAAGVLSLFLGTSIGNVDRENAIKLLSRVREAVQPGWLLIGQDPNSDLATLNGAYNGPLMAAFHKNVLARMMRELGAVLDLNHFQHEARFFKNPLRTEAHVVAIKSTVIKISDREFEVAAGESIRTDVSWKYNKNEFLTLLSEAGWCPVRSWLDDDGLYRLHLASSQS